MNQQVLISTLAGVVIAASACTIRLTESYFFNPMAIDAAGERVEIQGHGGATLVGRYLAHPEARGTLVYFGGNAEYVDLSGRTLRKLAAYRLNVLMVDYRGYGASEGRPSIDTFFHDSAAVFRFGRSRDAAQKLPTLAYGFSLGGLAAAYVAAHERCDGLVLEATGTDVKSWSKLLVPWYAKPFVRVRIDPALLPIDNALWVGKFSGPLLVLTGQDDEQAPPAMSRKLLNASPSPAKTLHMFRPGRHGDIKDNPDFERVLAAFLQSATSR